jgi:nitrate reductase gamma subunit
VNESVSTDVLLYGVLPYVAIALFAAGCVERWVRHPATLTSRSSQFLENRRHFWAMVPFHYGLLLVLAGHVAAFAAPRAILDWNGTPARLYALEAVGLGCGLLAAGGLVLAIVRRASVEVVRKTTRSADWIVFLVLLVQLATGVVVAVRYSWGSSWFAAVATPYLRSILALRPDVAAIAALPVAVKTHVVCAWVLVAVCPFSRLVHVIATPVPYLWRRPQVVRWYGPRAAAR